MKKILLFLVALFTSIFAFAYDVEIDGIYYNLDSGTKTAKVTYGNNKYSGDVTILEKVTYNAAEYSVTSIDSYAFSSCLSLNTITIPNSVTSIGAYAFKDCSSLTAITIPNSVTSIGEGVFYFCSSLAFISIPNSLNSIGEGAFLGTPWLNNQPSGCIYINNCLYTYKGKMLADTHIDVKEGTTMICNGAFEDCSSLASITIPNSVTSIGNSTFSGCSSLKTITIPNSINLIGVGVFSSCSSLTSITIPNSVISIGEGAFFGCSSLTSITIEATTPPTLEEYVFEDTPLTAIYIPNNTHSAYKEAWGTNYIFVNNETTLTIDVETPGTLSDKILDAGQRPINVSKLIVTGALNDDDFTCMRETMTSLVDIDLSDITNTTGINFNGKNNLVKIILPDNLNSIGNNAFYNCSSLTSITIGNNITSIEKRAFYSCSSLASITIPNSVTSIGNYAFFSCLSLTSITIGNSVTSIGAIAFSNCSSLRFITCLGLIPPSANDLRAQYETSVLLVPKGSLNAYKNHVEWGKFLNIQELEVEKYTITTAVNDNIIGYVTKGGEYAYGTEISLTANTNNGYHFVKWSDGNTDNPRIVVVTQDSTFTAIFEADTFAIATAVNDDAMGAVTEGGEYTYGTKITLTAIANDGYRFVKWSDGNTENPRIVTVTENKTYTVEFTLEEFALYAISVSPELGYVKHTIEAIAIEGFEFDRWSDDNTENPRTIILTEDTKLYAYFRMAQGGNPVDLETSKISFANIYIQNGTLHIEGATTDYHILDAAGRLIYTGNATTLTLPRGIYLVTTNGEVEKIVL